MEKVDHPVFSILLRVIHHVLYLSTTFDVIVFKCRCCRERTSCGALNAAVRQHSRSASVTTFYVLRLAELPVMLRPAFEEYKLLFVCSAVDVTSQYRLLTRWSLVLLWEPLFPELCVGDAGNTLLWARLRSLFQGVSVICFGSAAS